MAVAPDSTKRRGLFDIHFAILLTQSSLQNHVRSPPVPSSLLFDEDTQKLTRPSGSLLSSFFFSWLSLPVSRAIQMVWCLQFPEHWPEQVTSPMSTPGLDEVMAFLADRGYSRAASALLDDVLSRGGGAAVSVADAEPPENLPPLRMSPPGDASSSSDNDDDAFVSIHSSPGMLHVTRYLIY